MLAQGDSEKFLLIYYDFYGKDIANGYSLTCVNGNKLEYYIINKVSWSFIFGHVVIVLSYILIKYLQPVFLKIPRCHVVIMLH